MSDIEIRTLADTEWRESLALFRAALHVTPPTDEQWAVGSRSYEPGRTLGAFCGDTLAGTAFAWSSDLLVPGGAVVPMAAVTRVGVRSDFRRRGVLRELMRRQLADVADRGEVLAALRPTEPVIYGRFGYGQATRGAKTVAAPRNAVLRPEVSSGGRVRLVTPAEALAVMPGIYERAGRSRPGTMARPSYWWTVAYERAFAADEHIIVAVHSGPTGDDGYLMYRPTPGALPGTNATLAVDDFVAAAPDAVYGLWRFLLGVDLVDEVTVWTRPTDEPIAEALTDPRAITSAEHRSDLWLRLVDVPKALAAREYGPATVVLEVEDPLLPSNSGIYRLTPDGATRTTATPDLSLGVDVLAMLYLGTWRAGALTTIGRIRELTPGAAAKADTLFAVPQAAWCGTFF
ncbi:GNAT family N-acetyltransferase [Actinokineospora terrae]|uniref:Predicted acetyltransferase n=1 Tax=Actinokineospora terrae TaxID=155974 RepID=A0A1H9N4W1_9PSEU|nr:GNAT family N-acetyltransferase [Actinokineospora terrae]SER30453.1 Predicted acetyltransferase [Actinokineospora terrae]